jgi:hypothetical protein
MTNKLDAFIYDFAERRGLYYTVGEKKIHPKKKLVIYPQNRPKIIEVTVEKEVLNRSMVSTQSGKKMWVNKKELF